MRTRRFLLSISAFSILVVVPWSSVAFPSESNNDYNVSSSIGQNSKDSPSSVNGQTVNRFPKTWVSNLFYETLVNFSVSKNVGSSACRKQTQMYERNLENGSMWAVQMSESWSRYPNGILVGTTHQMGVYEECINVQQPVQGQFCIPLVKLKSATDEDFTIGKPEKPQINDPAWREILGFVNRENKIYRNEVKFGICIPDSCSATDLQISLQEEFDKHFLPFQVKASIEVDSILCSTKKDKFPFDDGFYVTSALVGFIFFICIVSTTYHLIIMTRNNNGENIIKIPKTINLFSIIENGRVLFKYDKNNKLNIFNGIKVLVMIFVLFGHKFLYLAKSPLTYGKRIEMVQEIGPDILLTSMNLVDPFFFITGYLIYVLLVSQFSKPGTNLCHIPFVIIYRYTKMLPSYVVMILLTAFVIPHLGDGPFWAANIWPEAEKCKNYWWANILVVSNFIDAENQCLIASWYISCVIQYLVIGSIVVYIYVKNRRVGTYLMVLLLCLSLVMPYIMTYSYRGWGIFKLTTTAMDDPRRSYEFKYLYRPFYLRATPYISGLFAGVVVEELKKREIKFPQIVIWAGTFMVIAACTWVQLYSVVFYDINRPYNVQEQSVYSTLSHCTWTVILFWITVCHYTTGYGPITKLLNNRIVIPLGRLSYAVYLVNITVMMVIESRQRMNISPSPELVIDGWIFSTVRTYLIALVLYLTIEAPFGLLIKRIFYGMIHTNEIQLSTNVINKTEAEQKDFTRL